MVKVLDLKEKSKLIGYLVRKRKTSNSAWQKSKRYAGLLPPEIRKFYPKIKDIEEAIQSGLWGEGEIKISEVYRGVSGKIYPQKAESLNVVDCRKFSFPNRS